MHRREFLKRCTVTAAGSLLLDNDLFPAQNIAVQATAKPEVQDSSGRLDSVRPIIGTGWRGHLFPGAVMPFGMVQLSPDTAGGPEPKWNTQGDWYEWDHCAGYHYPDNVVLGFSHTHLAGTGSTDLGDVLVMPVVEGRNWSWEAGAPPALAELQTENLGPNSGWVFDETVPGYRSFFSHQREEARPGYYRVHLDTPEVDAELTATTRCGMHRYRYPALKGDVRRGVLLDLVHGIGCNVYRAELNIESSTRISGFRCTHGWARDRQVYFVMEFSQPSTQIEINVDGKIGTASAGDRLSGTEIKAAFARAPDPGPFMIRVGVSPTSIEGAAKNLSAEIPHWNFDDVVRNAKDTWSRALAVFDIELLDSVTRETFYTNAYHGLVTPATFNDVDGTYRGQDGKNHTNPGFTKYSELSIWDIYRSDFPVVMLMQPQVTDDIVRTMLADYEQLGQHSLPAWPLWGNETWSMTGFHSASMILGAYVRGFRGFDVASAYTAIRDTALTGAEEHGKGKLQATFRQYGYVPRDLHRGSVSHTLDFSYDYWCAGAMAELLGKREDAAMFYKLGQNYCNVYDPSTGFMRGKTADGQWDEPFRPDKEYLDDYIESDAWQFSFGVPHDIRGLIELHGGDAAFVAKLDSLFTASSTVLDAPPDITGMVGQDAQGNEPSNHIPFLYAFAGAAWKTQYWVRKVASLYRNTPAGVPGNDDCGQLSSWFVFASLGFYPVNPANGVYVIGSPLVNRAILHNPVRGTCFTIIAERNSRENMFIQRAEFNGRELTRSWLSHAELTAGGELRFQMGSKPNKEWAGAPMDRPPSGLADRPTI